VLLKDPNIETLYNDEWKKNLVNKCNEILLDYTKNLNTDTCYNMDDLPIIMLSKISHLQQNSYSVTMSTKICGS
jgi:hypothetical protein